MAAARYTVDELLIEARLSLPHRPSPAEALAAEAMGALLIDIRGDDQRRASGLIRGALLCRATHWNGAATRLADATLTVRGSAPTQHAIGN